MVKSLHLLSFRNYRKISLELGSGLNVLVGLNGQGKTNLLEALYFLARGSSFRSGTARTLIQSGQPSAIVRCEVVHHGLASELKATLDTTVRFRLNSKPVSRNHIASLFPVVLFSPESLAAIKEAPEHRRSLADDLLWMKGPEFVEVIESFKKVLKTRNRLLKDQKNVGLGSQVFERTLMSLNEIYLPVATRLTWERLEVLQAILPFIQKIHRTISGQTQAQLTIDYLASGESAVGWSYQQVYDALRARIIELAKAERDLGSTLVGPHKHDIRILIDGNDSRYYCSQGQQRTLILAFKMAQIMYHDVVHQKFPLLLLDDVQSELDAEKQKHLMAFLNDIKAQTIMTVTELADTAGYVSQGMRMIRVSNGAVETSFEKG